MNQTINTGIIGGNPLPCSSCEHILVCKFSGEMAKAQEVVSRLCKENTAFAGNFIKPIKVECYHYKALQQPLTIKYSTADQTRQEKINQNMAENYGD